MNEQPTPEHQWLQKLVGNWVCDSECVMAPDQPPMKSCGTETVRSLGGFWTIGEGTMSCENEIGSSVMTLGYNSQTKRFVGTFVASMMTHLWPYNGSLDDTGRVLTLDSEGPSFSGDGTMSKYQDAIEFIDDDHRTLTSQVQLPSGEWQRFMTARYRRVSKPTVTPYLFFAGRCDEAIEYYCKALDAQVEMIMRFNESPDPVPEGMLQAGFETKVMHASFRVAGTTLMASDGCDDKSKFEGFRLALAYSNEADARRAFQALADGGNIQMPLTKTFWSPCYGMVTDRFGVGWMVMVHDATMRK